MNSSKKTNGHATKVAPTTPVNAAGVKPVSEDERIALRTAQNALLTSKVLLADLAIQTSQIEGRRAQLIQQVALQSQGVVDQVKALAAARGIDADGSKERWNFNLDTYEFSKFDEPAAA